MTSFSIFVNYDNIWKINVSSRIPNTQLAVSKETALEQLNALWDGRSQRANYYMLSVHKEKAMLDPSLDARSLAVNELRIPYKYHETLEDLTSSDILFLKRFDDTAHRDLANNPEGVFAVAKLDSLSQESVSVPNNGHGKYEADFSVIRFKKIVQFPYILDNFRFYHVLVGESPHYSSKSHVHSIREFAGQMVVDFENAIGSSIAEARQVLKDAWDQTGPHYLKRKSA